MNPYLNYVQGIKDGVALAKNCPDVTDVTQPSTSAEKVLLFSPHPDDECITGLLPLRLMQEAGKQIINVPVTFGSKPERQQERAKELEAACAYLGWTNYRPHDGFAPLSVEEVVLVLQQHNPQIIFAPHADDWNPRHIETHQLVIKALAQMDEDFRCSLIETEFWKPMDQPNLMIEGRAEQVADLVAATSLHTGEVQRNPYHLMLPAWMQDNVRRGSELVGGPGNTAQDFSFATLYRLRKWENGKFIPSMVIGTSIAANPKNLMEIF